MTDTTFPPCPTHATFRNARFVGGEPVWVSINGHVYQGKVLRRGVVNPRPCRDRLGAYWVALVGWEDETAPMVVLCHEDELAERERG